MSRSHRFAIAAAFTALAVTACELPQGDIKDPRTWGNYFLDKFATERADAMNLEPGHALPAKPRTVLLITGVTIPAVWFDPIKARLERDGFHAVVYEPPALLSGDLTQNSQALATVVDQIRAQTGEDRIDILAECTGGLIAREYVQALGGDAHVRRLVTFISPQHGLPKAPWAKSFVGWDALDDLTPGSDFLHEVNDAPLPANVPITSIYSCTDEYIQPYATSNIPGAKNIELCNGFVGHFQFFYDPSIYDIMWKEISEPAPTDAIGPNAPVPSNPSNSPNPSNPADPANSGSGGNGAVDPLTSPADTGAGCSSSGRSPGWLGVVAMAAVLGLGRRRRSGGVKQTAL